MTAPPGESVVRARGVGKTFRRETGQLVQALSEVTLEAAGGSLTTLVGPDGSGKSTLLRLVGGLMRADSGSLEVLGIDVGAQPQAVQDRISYLPQRFGLYEDLSVQENLDLYADLHGVTAEERSTRYPRLMEMTALAPFRTRLAAKLSGGMKQKLGLACTLVRLPDLLLLDEPTVGVDPLSRRELWSIIEGLVRTDGLAVLVSTSYLDEAERSEHVVVMHEGRVLVQGAPQEVRSQARGRTFVVPPPPGQPARGLQSRLLEGQGIVDAVPQGGKVRFVTAAEPSQGALDRQALPLLEGAAVEPVTPGLEDGFMVLLRAKGRPEGGGPAGVSFPGTSSGAAPTDSVGEAAEVVIEAKDLVRRFGDFTAVDHTSFEVRRGEVFGLLGPNGAGKTTTFRMLCGLLPASSGTLRVAGADLRRARAAARQRVGYVSQKFALYGKLSVRENLEFFGGSYGLRNARLRDRMAWALAEFDLARFRDLPSEQLPGGFKQRLAMAAALLHEPEILFLDEPTSGADPIARREFWRRITALSERRTTVVVTTHFMEEAEYCDRLVIQDAGAILAQGTPAAVRGLAAVPQPTMEDAFIAVVQLSRRQAPASGLQPVAS